jgi:hypothetical protein
LESAWHLILRRSAVDNETSQQSAEEKRESGVPGGGAGRRDEVGGSGVYPATGPFPEGDAEVKTPGSWGKGDYEESGDSELVPGIDAGAAGESSSGTGAGA